MDLDHPGPLQQSDDDAVIVGDSTLGGVPLSRAIRGVTAGGVALPSGAIARGGGAVAERARAFQPILRPLQRIAAPGPIIGTGTGGVPAQFFFEETLEGLEAYEAYLKGWQSYWYQYFSLNAEKVDPAKRWYLMVPLRMATYSLERVNYSGRLFATEGGVTRRLADGNYFGSGKSFPAWMPEWAPGSPPRLWVAWAPEAPTPYQDHMGLPGLGTEGLNSGRSPLEGLGGVMGPVEIPIPWSSLRSEDPILVGHGNYTPQLGDAAYSVLKSEILALEAYAKMLSELSPEAQEVLVKLRDKGIGEEFAELALEDHPSVGEELKQLEAIYEEVTGHSPEGVPEWNTPPYGPFNHRHIALYNFGVHLAATIGPGIPSGNLSKEVREKLGHDVLGEPLLRDIDRWAVRINLSKLPGIGKPPNFGHLIFFWTTERGQIFGQQDPGLDMGFHLGSLPAPEFLPELQRLEGTRVLGVGRMATGDPVRGRVRS